MEVLIGLNVLSRFGDVGLGNMSGTRLRCMTYNANLDYAFDLFETYPTLEKMELFVNEERITHSGINTDRILSMMREGKLELHRISENERILHAKAYSVYKGDECILAAVGSPNLTSGSNQGTEILILFHKPVPPEVEDIWNQIMTISEELVIPIKDPPRCIYKSTAAGIFDLDPDLIEGFWEHQKVIMDWLSRRQRSIVNIPPGTGKTRIGLAYLKHLKLQYPNLASIVLVPTLTLLGQWNTVLQNEGLEVFIGDTDFASYSDYLGAPEGRVLITLYSRFWKFYDHIAEEIGVVQAPAFLLADECHNVYSNVTTLMHFTDLIEKTNVGYFHLGLSATIDTFRTDLMTTYVDYCGGTSEQFNISLSSFYARWNSANSSGPILKPIDYRAHVSRLSETEMKEYIRLTKRVGMEARLTNLKGDELFSAAIKRASYVRSTQTGIVALRQILDRLVCRINSESSIVFVQTNEIAAEVRRFITEHNDWDNDASAYIYDSTKDQSYLDYAMSKFKANKGFCLISERMLSEGFDLPSVSMVVLHGSHRSERDWIQKIGRAIRYDSANPQAIATVVDIVFADPDGDILPIEADRYETLCAISHGGSRSSE